MSSTHRPALVGGLVGSLSAFLVLSATGTLPVWSDTRREYLAFVKECEREWQRGSILDRKHEAMWRRITGKFAVVRELRAGHLTLAEAACHFRALEAATQLGVTGSAGVCRTADFEGERLCQQVLLWARKRRPEDRKTSVEQARMKEWTEEMETLRGPDGIIHLPE